MAAIQDKVISDLGMVGKYRARILESKNGPVLDVREFVVASEPGAFEGFTRKGIRIGKPEARTLAEAILKLEASAG